MCCSKHTFESAAKRADSLHELERRGNRIPNGILDVFLRSISRDHASRTSR
jgi:hypothetical protein